MEEKLLIFLGQIRTKVFAMIVPTSNLLEFLEIKSLYSKSDLIFPPKKFMDSG